MLKELYQSVRNRFYDHRFDTTLGVVRSNTGMNVSEIAALSLPALKCALDVVASGVAAFDLYTFERLPNGLKKEAEDHPVYDLLLNNPCPRMTPCQYFETLVLNALWGRGVAEIIWGNNGFPLALNPIPYSQVTIEQDQTTGNNIYRIGHGGNRRTLLEEQVINIAGPSPDGSKGYELLCIAGDIIGTGLAAEQYTASFFNSGARPGALVKCPVGASKDARDNVREGLKQHTGPEAVGKSMFLEQGWDLQERTVSNHSNQLTETRKQNSLAICQFFNIPPYMLHVDVGAAPGGVAEDQHRAFILNCLKPWLRKIQQEHTRKLFLPAERNRYCCEFDTSEYLSPYIFNTLKTGIDAKILRVNEARNIIGYGPDDELEGLQLTVKEPNGIQPTNNTDGESIPTGE